MKPGCITMNWRQSNTQWSGGMVANPALPKKFRMQKSTGKVLASIFWDQDRILLTDYLPEGQTINIQYYSFLLVLANDGHFEGKNLQEGQQGDIVLARKWLGSPGTCNPEENSLPGLRMS
jgi:hypothetical protein